jgi:hypothetical protein
MGLESASVDLLSEVLVFEAIKMALMCCMFNCVCSTVNFLRMMSSSRMKFCMMAIYFKLINCSLPDVTVSRLPVQFSCILYV